MPLPLRCQGHACNLSLLSLWQLLLPSPACSGPATERHCLATTPWLPYLQHSKPTYPFLLTYWFLLLLPPPTRSGLGTGSRPSATVSPTHSWGLMGAQPPTTLSLPKGEMRWRAVAMRRLHGQRQRGQPCMAQETASCDGQCKTLSFLLPPPCPPATAHPHRRRPCTLLPSLYDHNTSHCCCVSHPTLSLLCQPPLFRRWLNSAGAYWGRPVGLLRLPDGSMLVADDWAQVVYRIAFNESSGAAGGSATSAAVGRAAAAAATVVVSLALAAAAVLLL